MSALCVIACIETLRYYVESVVNIPTKIFRGGKNFILVVWYQRF